MTVECNGVIREDSCPHFLLCIFVHYTKRFPYNTSLMAKHKRMFVYLAASSFCSYVTSEVMSVDYTFKPD